MNPFVELLKQFTHFNIPKVKKTRSPIKALITSLILVGLVAFGIDFVSLPAYNLHDQGFIILLIAYLGLFGFLMAVLTQSFSSFTKIPFTLAAFLFVAMIVLNVLGSEPLNASKFRDQIQIVETNDFNDTFSKVQLSQIPLVDWESAQRLGDKKIGNIQGLGSQFNINSDYTLLSVGPQIYRVSPLEYQDFIKWFQNRNEGIPGYIKVNVTDANDVSLVQLDKGITYSPSAFFFQDLLRHVRFTYRTEILQDFSFEIDDEGNPYYVISVVEPEIGWFSGYDTSSVIIVDAISGAMVKYTIEDMPRWIDRAQPANIAWAQIDNWGYYVNGFINTILGQKDMIQTTDGYNYVNIDNQTYMFSGMTSVGADRSIVGFALINLRTKEASYFKIGGADEVSAMSSAAGQVQDLGYTATFPVLLNIQSIPTYFMSLKDAEGLIKQYAMVNVSDYSLVAVGDNVAQTLKIYTDTLISKGLIEVQVSDSPWIEATLLDVRIVEENGTTHYYVRFSDDSAIYEVEGSTFLELIFSNPNDLVKYKAGLKGDQTSSLDAFDNLALDY